MGEVWHVMRSDEVVLHFRTSPSTGLTEAAARENRARFGGNELPGTEARSFFEMMKSQASSLPMALSALAAGLSAATGGLVEGMLMLGVAAANVAVGSVYEHRAESSLKIAREAVDSRARVVREGRVEEIPFDEVVKGDILSLQAGSRIPADARLVHSKSLAVDESSLTGESIPVNKSSAALPREDVPIVARVNMVYRSTLVVEGTGRAVVVATGHETVSGKLQRFLGDVFPPEALMARDLGSTARKIMKVGLGACGVLAVASILRGYGLPRIAKESISFFAGCIPSGLSTLAISAFALGHEDLRRNRILVRRLQALGNLASIQVVCLDKTGTLTHNRMTVTDLHAGGKHIKADPNGFTVEDVELLVMSNPDALWLIKLSALCNEARAVDGKKHKSTEGSATERSLIALAERAGMDSEALRADHPVIEIVHRSEEHHFMVTVHGWGERGLLEAMKGSPMDVLERCSHHARNGQVMPLEDEERDAIELENLKMAGTGLRVLGVAYRTHPSGEKQRDTTDQSAFVWVGLIGLADPLREEAKPLIDALHRAGIRTAVITGDQSFTAQHIGSELRLSGDAPLQVLDASDLGRRDAAGTRSIAVRAHVFARLNPTQKLQVIQAYQSAGMSVAMVGDGLNDVLALKVADVGISMGQTGAGLARRSADLVLEDDDLQSVMFAIATGRAFFRNMRKSIRFLLTANHMDVLMELSERTGVIGIAPSRWQGLWTNLLCLSLAMDPHAACYTDERPVDPNDSLIRPHDMENAFLDAARLTAGAGVAGSFGVLRYGPGTDAGGLFARSASINQLLYGIECREGDGHPPAQTVANPFFDKILAGAVAGHLLAALLPGVGKPVGEAVLRSLDILALGAGGLFALALLRPRSLPESELSVIYREEGYGHVRI